MNSSHPNPNQTELLQQVEQHFKQHSFCLTQEVHYPQVESNLDYQQKLLQTVIDVSPNMIFVKNWAGEYILANHALAKFYGTTVEQMLGKTDADFNPNRQQTDFYLSIDRQVIVTREEKWISSEPVRRFDGEIRWFQTTKIPIPSFDETTYYVLGIATDVTKRHEAERVLWLQAEQERLLNTITLQIYQRFSLLDIFKEIVVQLQEILMVDRALIYRPLENHRYQAIAEQKLPQCPSVKNRVIEDAWLTATLHEIVRDKIVDICALPAPSIGIEMLPSSTLAWLCDQQIKSLVIIPIPCYITTTYSCNYDSLIWGFLIAHQCSHSRRWLPEEISLLKSLAAPIAIAIQQGELRDQLEIANQKLQLLVNHDGLTGLANRRRLDEYLQQEWKRMARESQPLSLLLLDVDFFKKYNDTYGHLQGDQCLKKIAQIIQKNVKRPADLVARYGGEEFAVILPNTPSSGAKQVAKRIQQGLQELQLEHRASSVSPWVTLSCGISGLIPNHYQSPYRLIQSADQALYQAKEQGKNQIIQADSVLS